MNAIVCVEKDGGIGLYKSLLFHSSKDMSRFKSLTENNIIVMGRKTFETFPNALKNRVNVVITHDTEYKADNIHIIKPEELEQFADRYPDKQIWIIGGAEIYTLFKDKIKRWEITYVPESIEHNIQIKDLIEDVRSNWLKIGSEYVTDLDKKTDIEKSFCFESYIRLPEPKVIFH